VPPDGRRQGASSSIIWQVARREVEKRCGPVPTDDAPTNRRGAILQIVPSWPRKNGMSIKEKGGPSVVPASIR